MELIFLYERESHKTKLEGATSIKKKKRSCISTQHIVKL